MRRPGCHRWSVAGQSPRGVAAVAALLADRLARSGGDPCWPVRDEVQRDAAAKELRRRGREATVLWVGFSTTRKTAIVSIAIRSALNIWYAAGIYPQRTSAHALRVSHIPTAHHIFSALRVFIGPKTVPSLTYP
jgi:hypothetical protein